MQQMKKFFQLQIFANFPKFLFFLSQKFKNLLFLRIKISIFFVKFSILY